MQRCWTARGAGCLLAAVLLGGCAAHRREADGSRLLETYIEQVRQASAAARPARLNDAATLERNDPELAAARLLLAAVPTAERYRRVAEAYARRGVYDAAYDGFTAALRLDPRDAASFDGLARVWREWGFPHAGLSSAYRAIYFAPGSPAAYNTLGTLLVRLRQPAAARTAFERALALAPGAAYALNNLCYAALLEGDRARAIDRCRGALQADPALVVARNNLALAYAASGDLAAASREFLRTGGAAAERYNMGVALLATERYDEAAAAFDEAAALQPSLIARQRARQARALAARSAPAGLP